jgi:hypothetical protein
MSIKKSNQQENINSEDPSLNQADSGQDPRTEDLANAQGSLNESGTGTIKVTG